MEQEQSQFDKDTQTLSASSQAVPEFKQMAATDGSAAVQHEKVYHEDAINEHLENFGSEIAAAASPALATPPLAVIYAAARPVLLLAQGLLFFKPAWQTALKVLIAGLDAEFPTAVRQ